MCPVVWDDYVVKEGHNKKGYRVAPLFRRSVVTLPSRIDSNWMSLIPYILLCFEGYPAETGLDNLEFLRVWTV